MKGGCPDLFKQDDRCKFQQHLRVGFALSSAWIPDLCQGQAGLLKASRLGFCCSPSKGALSGRNAGEWAVFRCSKEERAGPGHEAPLQDNKLGDVCNQEALRLSGYWRHIYRATKKSILEFMYLFILRTYCILCGKQVTRDKGKKINVLSLA